MELSLKMKKGKEAVITGKDVQKAIKKCLKDPEGTGATRVTTTWLSIEKQEISVNAVVRQAIELAGYDLKKYDVHTKKSASILTRLGYDVLFVEAPRK